MNYKRIYDAIISKRQREISCGYIEKHHIVPRSLGGSNEKDNIVALTAREHFICHYLLAKMYEKETFEWYKMNHAFLKMKCASSNQNRYFNSRLYSALAENRSKVMSVAQAGKKNSNFGKIWINKLGTEINKKIDKSEIIPEGWVKGRNVKICMHCKKKPALKDRRYCGNDCKKTARGLRPAKLKDEMPCIGVSYVYKSISDSKEFILRATELGFSKRQILTRLGLSHGGHHYKKLDAVVSPLATNQSKE